MRMTAKKAPPPMSTLPVLRTVGRQENRTLKSGVMWIRHRPPPASSSHAVVMTCLTTVTVVLGLSRPPAQRALGLWSATVTAKAWPDPPLPTRYLDSTGVGHMIHRGFFSSTARCTRLTELSSSRLTSSARSVRVSWTWNVSLIFIGIACLLGAWKCLEIRCQTAFLNTSALSNPNPCPTWTITRCPQGPPHQEVLRPEPAVVGSHQVFQNGAFP